MTSSSFWAFALKTVRTKTFNKINLNGLKERILLIILFLATHSTDFQSITKFKAINETPDPKVFYNAVR